MVSITMAPLSSSFPWKMQTVPSIGEMEWDANESIRVFVSKVATGDAGRTGHESFAS